MKPNIRLGEEITRLIDRIDGQYLDRRCTLSFRQGYEQTLNELRSDMQYGKPDGWLPGVRRRLEQHIERCEADTIQLAGRRQAHRDLLAYLEGNPVDLPENSTVPIDLAAHLQDFTRAMWDYGYQHRVHGTASSETTRRSAVEAQQQIAQRAAETCKSIYIHHQQSSDAKATQAWASLLNEWTERSTLE